VYLCNGKDLRDLLCVVTAQNTNSPPPPNPLERNSVEFCINLNENLITKYIDKTKMVLLALEIIYTEYPKEEWLQV
jgi:hypothetical protein